MRSALTEKSLVGFQAFCGVCMFSLCVLQVPFKKRLFNVFELPIGADASSFFSCQLGSDQTQPSVEASVWDSSGSCGYDSGLMTVITGD